MNTKNIITFVLVCISLAGLSSCEKFLHVTPQTQVPTEDFYSQESGFEDALIGCYIKLKSDNLYGRFLTMSGMDYLAQYYSGMTASSVENAYRSYDYADEDVEQQFKSVYNGLYNVILQANDIIEHIETGGDVIRKKYKRDFIKGEALAIRAFCHFDLLRIFGQVPMNATISVSLPYSEVTGVGDRPLYGFGQYLNKVRTDLRQAALLLADDPVRKFTLSQLNAPTEAMTVRMPELEDDFMIYRRFRFNYYAVMALTARVALYGGDMETASQAAREVIGARAEDGTPILSLAGDADFSAGHYTLPSETVVALSCTDLESRSVELEYLFRNDDSTTDPMRFPKSRRDVMFQTRNTANNNRYNRLWGEYSSGQGEVTPYLRKYFQNETSASEESKLVNRWQVPLIRLSEMYLIAMETEDNLEELNSLFRTYMLARNEQVGGFADIDEAKVEIVNEYRREFLGEGQMFFTYKRLKTRRMMWTASNMMEEDYIVPVPASERHE